MSLVVRDEDRLIAHEPDGVSGQTRSAHQPAVAPQSLPYTPKPHGRSGGSGRPETARFEIVGEAGRLGTAQPLQRATELRVRRPGWKRGRAACEGPQEHDPPRVGVTASVPPDLDHSQGDGHHESDGAGRGGDR